MVRLLPVVSLISLILLSGRASVAADDGPLHISLKDGKYEVRVDSGELFCKVDYRSYAKPIVYPIYGPGEIPMTRGYPMLAGTGGEATDHPHHKSMWFAHGDVNGVSFWDERGKVVTETAEIVRQSELDAAFQGQPTIRLKNRLIDPDGNQVCRETVLLSFGANEKSRWIDWRITTHADGRPITFGDTKEGTAALRVHVNLRPDNIATQGTDIPPAKAINSQGNEGEAVWGKRAKWVDYSGTIDGHLVGIAFFDNPNNLRHPTYWHARDYGLFSANPFGLSHFVGEGSDGSHTVPAGESLALQYRIVLHEGDASDANIQQLYDDYSAAFK